MHFPVENCCCRKILENFKENFMEYRFLPIPHMNYCITKSYLYEQKYIYKNCKLWEIYIENYKKEIIAEKS
jgi:hypothetical protein